MDKQLRDAETCSIYWGLDDYNAYLSQGYEERISSIIDAINACQVDEHKFRVVRSLCASIIESFGSAVYNLAVVSIAEVSPFPLQQKGKTIVSTRLNLICYDDGWESNTIFYKMKADGHLVGTTKTDIASFYIKNNGSRMVMSIPFGIGGSSMVYKTNIRWV